MAGVSDAKGRLSLTGVVSLAQDLAFLHYASCGLSIPQLLQKDLTWVITKQRFEITEYPLWLDEIMLTTWAQQPKGPFCLRDFTYSYAKNGKKNAVSEALPVGTNLAPVNAELSEEKPFMRATSNWIVLSTKTGRPVKSDEFVMGGLSFCAEQAILPQFPKINLPEVWDLEQTITPTVLDIDSNNHVNNTVYVRWILSVLPKTVENKLVTILDTYFVGQALFGDTLTARVSTTQNEDSETTCVHSIVKDDGTEVFRAQTQWKDEKDVSRAFI